MGAASEGYGQLLSQRLAAKLCRTVFVSYSAREDPALRLAVEAHLLHELESCFAVYGLQLPQLTRAPASTHLTHGALHVAASPKSATVPLSVTPTASEPPTVPRAAGSATSPAAVSSSPLPDGLFHITCGDSSGAARAITSPASPRPVPGIHAGFNSAEGAAAAPPLPPSQSAHTGGDRWEVLYG